MAAFTDNRDNRPSVAEGVGFEPTVTFQPRRFSRPVPSTARPPLRTQTLAIVYLARADSFAINGNAMPKGPLPFGIQGSQF